MKLAIGERNVATNLGTTPGYVVEYCFSIWITNLMNVLKFSTIWATMFNKLNIIEITIQFTQQQNITA